MKLAVVVQRYGETVNGGAELHARYIAEHLAAHADVEVLTTCATDYVSWRNDLPAGVERVNGVPIRRFKVARERNTLDFGRRSEHVFRHRHSLADELGWLEAEGPACPALVDHLSTHARDHDFCIFFSYRYYLAYHGARAVSGRAILVPTAERDPAMGLSMFKPIFRGVRALVYNSPEERAMIQAVAGNEGVPSAVVGVGSNVPSSTQANRFRQKFGVRGPFAIYIGRIDENKGCKELFDFFDGYIKADAGPLSLVLVGNSLLDVPAHPRIRHLGFLNDEDKFDALAAAELLVMPSYFESLSMVVLEAWALGRPVLVNGRCDVLKGQCLRSDAGLYYDNELEFIETLRAIEQNRWLSASLGRNGRQYFREHYDWGVVERKYLDLLGRLAEETAPATMEPLPGWLARRRDDCPAGADVVAALPAGPIVEAESSPERFSSPPPPAPRLGTPDRGSPRLNAPSRRASDQPGHPPGSSPPGAS